MDDGSGYVDLGLDNAFDFDDDGNLKMDYDQTWIAIDGQLVNMMLEFTDKNPEGKVLGALINYDGLTETLPKGLLPI